MKTNKQNQKKTNSKTSSELKNRSEQSSGTETATATETETATETAKTPETATETAPAKSPNSGNAVKPYVNFAERDFNRTLSVEKVLEKLRRWMPAQLELAEVVGRWVWITFPEPPLERVRADLSQLGFHWNNTRKCWQHPCGQTLPRGQQEPREKYSVWFPSAIEALRQKKARSQRDEVPFDREQAAAALGTALGKQSLARAAEVAAYDPANPYRYNGPARTAEEVAA